LHAEGFVDADGKLSADGQWASRLRLDHPLLVAECLRKKALPVDNEKLLAAVVAVFAYDRDDEIQLSAKDLPQKLAAALRLALLSVRPLARRLEEAGFDSPTLVASVGAALYYWAQGRNWEEVIKITGIAEGDMASLILRTADNLRQIAALRDSHPEVAACAKRAREAILRAPVLLI